MSIKEQLTADMKEAMKSHDKDRLSVIRFVRGAIRQAEIDGGHKELSDEDVIGVISKEVKMRKDSIEEFKKGGREDLVAKTQAEIDVLMPYLRHSFPRTRSAFLSRKPSRRRALRRQRTWARSWAC